MKKFVSILSVVIFSLLLAVQPFAALSPEQTEVTETTTYFDDGSYIVTTITEDQSLTRASGTKSGHKTSTYYNNDNEALWSATVNGTFTYNGSYATCTAASITHQVYASNWKITSATVTKTGNKAIGNVTAKRYLLGVPVQTNEKTITLSCSASGTLS